MSKTKEGIWKHRYVRQPFCYLPLSDKSIKVFSLRSGDFGGEPRKRGEDHPDLKFILPLEFLLRKTKKSYHNF